MLLIRKLRDLRAVLDAWRASGAAIGFVPTMGALHAGHMSLIEAARRAGQRVVVSIFVNPTQFGPNEDFSRYPRDEEGDARQCRAAGADLIFLPPVEAMYPPGSVTRVHLSKLTDTLCGPFRPGHFDGVATIVAKLLNLVQPAAAYFGEKDAQQLAVIRRMVADLDIPVRIVGCPTVREPDGLAMSSRNRYLSPEHRRQATCIFAALRQAAAAIAAGQRDAAKLRSDMRAVLEASGPLQIEYAEVVDAATLQPLEQISSSALLAIAVRIGGTRLIDNVSIAM
jgi:pantoate--beta-alanine ligase